MRTLRVGTRTSPLALQQTKLVVDQLKAIDAAVEIEIVGISTKGDRLQQVPLTEIGGKGVFVREVEARLLANEIDFAVHSLKDMPAILPKGLVLAAHPKRANPLDCLILKSGKTLEDDSLIIGTSSIRRAKQLAEKFPSMDFVPIRGNIETRLKKMESEGMDGTVLAAAGLERMNYLEQLTNKLLLPVSTCIPAVGQGILAIECREVDHELFEKLEQLNDGESQLAAQAERTFLAAMNGNCDIPIGAFARKESEAWLFDAFLAEDAKAIGQRLQLRGNDPIVLAKQASEKLL